MSTENRTDELRLLVEHIRRVLFELDIEDPVFVPLAEATKAIELEVGERDELDQGPGWVRGQML